MTLFEGPLCVSVDLLKALPLNNVTVAKRKPALAMLLEKSMIHQRDTVTLYIITLPPV